MRARLIGGPQGRAEAVRQLGQIAVGDESVAQRLLLLFAERAARWVAARRLSGYRL